MGWKGTLRSVQAAVRASERNSRRRQRELERYRHTIAKANEIERAAYEVEVYRNRVEQLVSVHRESSSRIDWQAIAQVNPPNPPQRTTDHEQSARRQLDTYRPGIVARLFNKVEQEKARLENKIEQEQSKDEALFRQALAQHEKEYAEWKEQKDFAERLLAGDPASYLEAISEINPFSEISDLGSGVRFEVLNAQLVKAEIAVHGEAVVPRETKSLLKSGKLSTKQTPKGDLNRLYQDYICSCALRVARELFAILPVDAVIVSALDTLVNSSTGHLEEQPVLSAFVPRRTFDRLNLDLIDPSDSMKNFVHNMDFKPSSGFRPVGRVSAEGLMHAG